jgi:hypothetical protein
LSGAISMMLVVAGLACLAMAMPQHWRQWRGAAPIRLWVARGLRVAGIAALLGGLLFCLSGAHPSIGVLVWVMQLALGAVVVAFALAQKSGG